MYRSTYQVKHVLELNGYLQWLLALLDDLIADPTHLLQGRVHGLQYWHMAIEMDPLLVHVLHTDDPDAVAADIKNRYERRLKEIFQ